MKIVKLYPIVSDVNMKIQLAPAIVYNNVSRYLYKVLLPSLSTSMILAPRYLCDHNGESSTLQMTFSVFDYHPASSLISALRCSVIFRRTEVK